MRRAGEFFLYAQALLAMVGKFLHYCEMPKMPKMS